MSARKRTELNAETVIKRLEEENGRFRSLVENTSDLIWEVDENGVNTYMSPKIREVLGYEPEELIGRTPFEFMRPDEAQFMAAVFRSIVAAQKRFRFSCLENVNLHKDGHEVFLETSAVPLFGPDGKFRGYRGIDRDITRRKQAEHELRKISIELQDSFNKVKLRSGLLPICDSCKRVMNEKGNWEGLDKYIAEHSEAEFSDSICDECGKKIHSEQAA